MANKKSKPESIDDFDLTKSQAFEKQSKTSPGAAPRSHLIPSLNASNARNGFLLAEILGPPLSKRKGYRKWL